MTSNNKINVFIILSPSIPSNYLKKINPQDIVLLGSGINIKNLNADVRHIQAPNYKQLKKITEQIAKSIGDIKDKHSRKILESFINDYYAYSIKPIWCHFFTLQVLINETGVKCVTIICAKHSGKQLPMLGYQTTESKRGSALLFGAYLGRQLPKAFHEIHFDYLYITRDLFCIEPLRQNIIRSANIFFSINFAVKSLWASLRYNKNPNIKKTKITLLIRVEHQKRFAIKLLKELKMGDASLLIFPQLSLGSFASLKKMYKDDLINKSVHKLSPSILLKALWKTKKDSTHLRTLKHKNKSFKICCEEIEFDYFWDEIINEILLMSVVLFYKNTLELIIKNNSIETLINFELVGRMAGVEALVAKEACINLKTIQTALVSSSPHVVFPVSPVFYSDGYESVAALNEVGAIKRGVAKYSGATFKIQQCKVVDKFTKIIFFSQPYEPEITYSILDKLAVWSREQGAKVIIKPHPRDNISVFSKIIKKHPKILTLSEISPEILLKEGDLCLTRTSSVAKEAIAFGLPTILCLWSEFDNSIRADYASGPIELQYRSYNKKDLTLLLDNPGKICHATKIMSNQLFSSKGVSDLARDLLN